METATLEADLYDADFYTWAERQAGLIRQGRFDEVDFEHVAEEIADLGRSQSASLESAYRLICLHQLKRMVQPERAGRSWTLTIGRERLRAARLLRRNPGLKPHRETLLLEAYADARAEAALETDLPLARFPAALPFTLAEIMDPEFWADPAP